MFHSRNRGDESLDPRRQFYGAPRAVGRLVRKLLSEASMGLTEYRRKRDLSSPPNHAGKSHLPSHGGFTSFRSTTHRTSTMISGWNSTAS